MASADTPDPGSQSGSSTTNSPANEPSAGTSGSTQSSTSTSTQTNSGSPSGTKSTNSATTTTGVAVSPSGAQLRDKTFKDGDQTASEEPDEEEETEVVGSEGSQDVSSPTQSPTPTLVAEVRTDAGTRKLSNRLDAQSAQASVAGTRALPAPVHAGEVVADKVVAAKESADAVVQRAADTVVSMTVAEQAPAVRMQAAAPVDMAPPDAETAAPVTVRSLVSGLLAAFGLNPLAANTPLAPAESPVFLMALLALGSRREFERSFSSLSNTTSSTPVATAALNVAPTAAVTAPVTTRVGWVTGANSLNDTVNRFGIAGTDVGTMWDNGITGDNPATTIVEQRQVLIAFGDTFSAPGMTGAWRMNTLFRSPDAILSDGLYVPTGVIHDPGAYSGSPMTYPNFSREIIGNYHYGTSPEVTMIPTAGISVPGAGVNGATRQYINFMAVKSWDSPGRWTTNYSAIAYSDDNGQNWTVVPASSVRAARPGSATVPYVSGNQNFQQGAFVKPPAGSPEATAGWVYSYGTPAGRAGTVYLSRVNQYQILDQTKYQYWNGSTWVANKPSAATPILPGTTSGGFFGWGATKTYPSVSEMSVQYNPYLKQYVMLYADQNNNVVMRTSTTPQGTWSAPKTLVTSTQYPGLYAPMIHPWSGTSQLKKADGTPEDPQYLYWNLSQWNEYNVALMRTDLSRV
jgi:hypothetical protein